MTTISSTNPTATTAAPGAPSASDAIEQIRMSAGGSPEEMLALASLDVEEAADRARQTRRLDREASGQLQRGAIKKRRKAAKLKLASQVVGAAASIATSAAALPEGKGYKALIESAGALQKAVSAGLEYRSDQVSADATLKDVHAGEAKQRAQDSGEHMEALERHQGKLLGGTERVAQLRHEAMMQSIRG